MAQALAMLISAALLLGFIVGSGGGERDLARAVRDGDARVIEYQIDTQHCRAVLWKGQRMEEKCEGEVAKENQ